jgi:hypothetical protein
MKYTSTYLAVSPNRIFFEDENGRAVAVTSARYVEMLRNFLTPELSRRGTEFSTIWFQQDGASAHTARASMVVVISLSGELPWPASSPDLSVCDYFLWGYLIAKVYTTRPRNIAMQKQISAITENMARRALENLGTRLEECARYDGQQITDVLFKTQ